MMSYFKALRDETGHTRPVVDSRHLALTAKVIGLSLDLRVFPKPAGWVR